MAIARIITSMPELSGGLVRDLNSRGFEVHILSSEQTITSAADLEIRLDIAGTEQTLAQVYANNSLVMQTTAAEPEEDIWAMLAAYDGDAEKNDAAKEAQEEIVPVVLEQNVVHEPVVGAQNLSAEDAEPSIEQNAPITLEENLASPVIARETVEATETPAMIAASTAEAVSHKAPSNEQEYEIDPELVPSMFNFVGSSFASDAPVKEVAATETKEEKPYLNGNDFRNLVAKKNGSWNFGAPKLVTAAGWAAVALLLLVSFMRYHSSIPPEANAGQVPFHASAPTANVVPVKSVMITNTGVPIKTNRRVASDVTTDIAEDTIVHYNGKAKANALESGKNAAVKYYTDRD